MTRPSTTVTRRVLLPDLESGWDEHVAEEDRSLVREVLSLIRELARFKQPRTQSSAVVTPGETSILRSLFVGGGAHARATLNAMDVDDDNDSDANAYDIDDDSIQYAITYNAENQYYIVNTLLPSDCVFTLDRLMLICSLSHTLILSNAVDCGLDLTSQRPFLNVRVNKHNNVRHLFSRLVIIEQLGSGPAVRTTSGLPLGDGVSVRRTSDGTIINSQGSARASKRARANPGS